MEGQGESHCSCILLSSSSSAKISVWVCDGGSSGRRAKQQKAHCERIIKVENDNNCKHPVPVVSVVTLAKYFYSYAGLI